MRAPVIISLYVTGLAVLFGGSLVLADAIVPDDLVTNWKNSAEIEHGNPSPQPAAPVPSTTPTHAEH